MDIPKKQISKKFIAAALLCMFAFIYVIHHIGNAFKENTELFTVTAETLENTVDVSGYIFRDEAAKTNDQKGTCDNVIHMPIIIPKGTVQR